jgi:hypothetical protein
MRFGFPVATVAHVNMAEEEEKALTLENGAAQISARGGEVITLKITPD